MADILTFPIHNKEARRVKFTTIFSLIGIVSFAVFSIDNFINGNYLNASTELFFVLVASANLVFLYVKKNIELAISIALALTVVALMFLLVTGGIAETGILWTFTFPALALFLKGRKRGVVWIAFLFILLLFFLVSELIAGAYIAYTPLVIRQLMASLFAVTLIIYTYQFVIEKSEKQLEEANKLIEEEKVKDDALLGSIGEGMVATDEVGKVIMVNDIGAKMLGREKAEIIGKIWGVDLPKAKNEKGIYIVTAKTEIHQALGSRNRVFMRCLYATKKGLLPVAVTASPVILNEKIVGGIVIFRDVSKEVAIDKEKSEFVSLASHQLNTPLSTINWYCDLLLTDEREGLSKTQGEFINSIFTASRRMVELVDALLTVSRIEMGTFAIEPIPLDVSALMDDVIKELERKIREKNLDLEFEKTKIETVKVDPNLLRIIFQNLLTNAIKYTRKGGRIIIGVNMEKINKKDFVLVKVSDNGWGIPKREQSKIFGKLFRADNVRTKVTDGTGLGLYIVKSIVEKTGGKIWFESEENKGSTFFVLFPKVGMKPRIGSTKLILGR